MAFAVLGVESLAGLVDGELPVDFDLLDQALPGPAMDLISQLGLGGAAGGTGGSRPKNRVHLVEPRAAFGRVDEAEAGGQDPGSVGGQAIV
jgi:hypothetical protein